MAAQSFAMGQAFGTSFQYGKRKISSMSNEEFNAITALELAEQIQTDVRAMIPSMNESFHRMETFQIDILVSMGKTLLLAVEKFFNIIGPSGGGVNPYVGTSDNPNQDFLDNLFDPNFNAQDQANIGDAAASASSGGTTPAIAGETAVEKYASRWINVRNRTTNFNSINIKEARYLLEQFANGNLPNMLFARKPLITKWESLQPKPATEEDVKDTIDTTSTGIVNQIASMFNQMKFSLAAAKKYVQLTGPDNVRRKGLHLAAFLKIAKKYNVFVFINRKANLQVDTAKSMAAFRIIPKT